MFFFRLFIFFLLILSGCQKYGLVVHQQKVDESNLASIHVGSPDPRKKDPPQGQMLIIEWWVPHMLVKQDAKLILHMILKDFTQKTLEFPINHRVGYVSYELIGEEFKKSEGLLTYQAEIVTSGGEVYRKWDHQLWVNLIQN